MKKLIKRNDIVSNTIQTYACICLCQCSCNSAVVAMAANLHSTQYQEFGVPAY